MVSVAILFLILHGFPEVATAESNLPNLAIFGSNIPGGFAYLTCSHNVSTNSSILYKFWKDGVNITSYQLRKNKLIQPLQTNDTGNYSCSSKVNGIEAVSIAREFKVSLFVSILKLTAAEGEDHNLVCYAAGETVERFFWEKNGVSITSESSSNLLLKNVSRQESGDIYQCSAVNRNGEKSNNASGKLWVMWLDAPSVEISPSVVREGDSTYLECTPSASPNYPPSSGYKWFRNGQRIALPAGYNNLIILRNLDRNDTGNYTCSMKHSELDIEKTSDAKLLTIIYMSNPYIVFNDNTSSTVIEGERVSFSCRVDSYYPGMTFNYSWEMNTGIVVSRSPDFVINSTTKKDENYYRCEVVGRFKGVSISEATVENLVIHYPPKGMLIFPFDSVFKLALNSSFRTGCYLSDYGKPKATLNWFNGNESSPILNGTQGKDLFLDFPSLKRSHAGNYTCKGLNYIDSVHKTVEIIVTEKPGMMEPPVVVETGERLINVRWIPPKFDGNDAVKTYSVEYTKVCEGCNSTFQYSNIRGLTLRISGLVPGTIYQIRIQANNQVGAGPFSNFTKAATKPALKPYAPTDFKHIFPPLSRAIMVSWVPPNNSDVYDHILEYFPSDESEGKRYKQILKPPANYTISNLKKYKAYNLTVYARNYNGDGSPAHLYNIFTREEEPEPVRFVNYILRSRSLRITWNPPNNIFGELQAYSVCHKRADSQDDMKCVNTTATSYNITNLQHAKRYNFQVNVFNNLFSTIGFEYTRSTIGLAPPPVPSVPEPTKSKITKTTFAINIVRFDETNGRVIHYDVIVMPLANNQIPNRSPSDYSNSEIADFVVGRLYGVQDKQQFIVGSGSTSGRTKRTLGVPSNPPLKENTVYAAFVRGYLTEDVYQSSPWYQPVITTPGVEKDDGLSAGAIAGIVIAVIVVCILIGAIAYFCSRKNHQDNGNIRMTEFNK